MRCGGVHLGYCSNIHPAQTWTDTHAVLRDRVTAVKRRVSPDAPFGVGLRLSGEAAATLGADAQARARLREELAAWGLYVFTLNGFPYGRFFGEPVKAAVYRPDWRDPARARYTDDLVAVLADVLPPGELGTISTVPGCFAPDADDAAPQAIAAALRAQAERLHRLAQERGVEIALALEPEPWCLLETTAQAVAFFEDHVLRGQPTANEAILRRHLGVCLDTCHAAVAFEDPRASVEALRAAGIRIAKVQATCGLRVRPVDDARVRALAAFADAVYLHQVVARDGDRFARYLDLPEAIAAYEAGATADEWRVHFHIPVFMGRPEPFENTQDELAEALPAAIATGCTHVEVETYTWDVLPPAHRMAAVEDAIAREIRWTQERLP